jgi:uncharacterized protein YwqG
MGDKADRRGFFEKLLREAVDVVREVNEAVRAVPTEPVEDPAQWYESSSFPAEDAEPWYESSPLPADPAEGSISEDELRGLCNDVGLNGRLEEIQRLIRPSLRLTRAEGENEGLARSRLGGTADLPPTFEWPSRHDNELDFLGQLNLAEVAAIEEVGFLPPRGLLLFFFDAKVKPLGLDPSDRGSCRVVYVDADETDVCPDPKSRATFSAYPLTLSRELMLPRSWSLHVEALDLDSAESAAWDELRERLAQAQGVELEELKPSWYALHRMLGYPEELGGEIELDCELVDQGFNVTDGQHDLDVKHEELNAQASEWRLLLQLSDDEELGTSWSEGFGRLYIWMRERDLRLQKYPAAWAILR